MATGYDALIAELESKYQTAEGYTSAARGYLQHAQAHWDINQDHEAIDALIDAVFENNQALEKILCQGFYGWPGTGHALTDALDRDKACPFITEAPPSEVTMDDVLSAMITSDFDQLQKFIGLVDAYRVALWHEPFNIEFYAALARGFRI